MTDDDKKPGYSSPSGVSDLDQHFRSRRSPRRSDDYTPITNLAELAPAISAIKRGQDRTADAVTHLDEMVRKEVKPKLDEVRDGFIRLETEHQSTKQRLKTLETDTKTLSIASPQPHDCYHEDDIKDLEEGHRGTQAELATVRADVATAQTAQAAVKEVLDKDVARIDGRSKTITSIAVSVILFVLASAGGFAAVFYTVKADVGHLSKAQAEMRGEVSEVREAQSKVVEEVAAAVVRVERAAQDVNDDPSPLEVIWCDLSPQERWRQKKMRGATKVPRRRCP